MGEDGKKMTVNREEVELLNSFAALIFLKKQIVQSVKSSTVGDRRGMQVKTGKELVKRIPSCSE